MRTGNIVITALGAAAAALGLWVTVRGWRLPTIAPRPTPIATARTAVLDAVRTVAVISAAGLVAGVAIAGLGGRLVMRVLAVTSGDAAQGRLTEAGETVGRISSDGTIGFIVFVGLFAGVLGATAHLVLRRWLPATAGRAGLVLGLVLLGTAGVSDPLAPDNVDFRVLRPTWLAVALVVATGLLLGTTLTTLAARLDAAAISRSWVRYVVHGALPLAVLPSPLLGVAALYVVGRGVWPQRPAWTTGTTLYGAPRVAVAIIALVATGTTVAAAVSIIVR